MSGDPLRDRRAAPVGAAREDVLVRPRGQIGVLLLERRAEHVGLNADGLLGVAVLLEQTADPLGEENPGVRRALGLVLGRDSALGSALALLLSRRGRDRGLGRLNRRDALVHLLELSEDSRESIGRGRHFYCGIGIRESCAGYRPLFAFNFTHKLNAVGAAQDRLWNASIPEHSISE